MRRMTSREGFTLMEVAIAVAVVVIGVLALFALIGTGLDMSAKAIADTHAGMFANNVFGSLRSVSLEVSETGKPGRWEEFWQDFQSGDTNISVAAPNAFVGNTVTIHNPPARPVTISGPLSVYGNDTLYPLVYQNIPYHDADTTNIVNIALRYKCKVESLFPLVGGSVLWTNRTMVTLKVWEGEFGSTDEDKALVFYSEFDNPGDL